MAADKKKEEAKKEDEGNTEISEKAQAQAAELQKQKGKNKGSGKGKVFLLAGAVMAVIFLPTTLLLCIGLLPAFVAFFISARGYRARAITVGAMNIAGCAPFLLDLWNKGNDFTTSFEIITDPMALVVMYGAASIGYMIDWGMAGFVATMLYEQGKIRMKTIRKRQKELIERWGPEVTGRFELDEDGFSVNPIDENFTSSWGDEDEGEEDA